jgi:hypothetical protein
VEVALYDEGDNVDDELVFVENGVDNDRNHGSEEVPSEDFNYDDDKTTGLEDGAEDEVSKLEGKVEQGEYVPATWHDVPVTALDRLLNVH